MNLSDLQNQLREAVQLYRAGDTAAAKKLVKAVLREHPNSADAWYVASQLSESAEQQRKLLERALSYDPNHRVARAALAKLGETSAKAQKPKSGAGRSGMSRREWLTLGGVIAAVVVVVIGGVAFLLSSTPPQPEEPVIDLPTLAPSFTPIPTNTTGPSPTMLPTNTPEPTATMLPTHTPTASPTQPIFAQTATVQLLDSQTQQADLYAQGTAAASQ